MPILIEDTNMGETFDALFNAIQGQNAVEPYNRVSFRILHKMANQLQDFKGISEVEVEIKKYKRSEGIAKELEEEDDEAEEVIERFDVQLQKESTRRMELKEIYEKNIDLNSFKSLKKDSKIEMYDEKRNKQVYIKLQKYNTSDKKDSSGNMSWILEILKKEPNPIIQLMDYLYKNMKNKNSDWFEDHKDKLFDQIIQNYKDKSEHCLKE